MFFEASTSVSVRTPYTNLLNASCYTQKFQRVSNAMLTVWMWATARNKISRGQTYCQHTGSRWTTFWIDADSVSGRSELPKPLGSICKVRHVHRPNAQDYHEPPDAIESLKFLEFQFVWFPCFLWSLRGCYSSSYSSYQLPSLTICVSVNVRQHLKIKN